MEFLRFINKVEVVSQFQPFSSVILIYVWFPFYQDFSMGLVHPYNKKVESTIYKRVIIELWARSSTKLLHRFNQDFTSGFALSMYSNL